MGQGAAGMQEDSYEGWAGVWCAKKGCQAAQVLGCGMSNG